MKQFFAFILLLGVCASCQKDVDPTDKIINPNDRLWKPSLYSTKTESSIVLTFYFFPGDLVYRDYEILSPEKIEIYGAEGQNSGFKIIKTFKNEVPKTYEITNLKSNVPYYYFVKTYFEGVQSQVSNKIMTVPGKNEDRETYVELPGEAMTMPSPNKDESQLAFYNREYTWDNGSYGAASIFLYNALSKKSELIEISSYMPDWVPNSQKIVYCTDNGEANINNYLPQQIAIYDVNTKKSKRLTTGRTFQINPAVSNDGQWIVYSSDEGHENKFDLWKMKIDGSQKSKIKVLNHNEYVGVNELAMASWSKNNDYVYYGVGSPNADDNGIFKLDVQNNSTERVFDTEWKDLAPSLSPDNTKMAFVSLRSGIPEIWLYNFAGKSFTQLTSNQSTLFDYTTPKIEWISNDEFVFGGYSKDGLGKTLIYKISL